MELSMGRRVVTWLVQACLLGLVLITPWFFGGVQPSVESPCFLALSFCLACWGYLIPGEGSRRMSLPLAMMPLLAALVLGAFHLLPLGEGLHSWLSPRDAEFRTKLPPVSDTFPEASAAAMPADTVNGNAADAEAMSRSGSLRLSRNPAATRHEWSLLAMGVITFSLGARFFYKAPPQLVLYALLAFNGVALSFFGIVQKMTWNGHLFWQLPLSEKSDAFASYVNRNNGAGYLCLCLAGAMGLLFWSFRRNAYRSESLLLNLQTGQVEAGRMHSDWISQVWDAIGNLTALKLTALIAVTLITAGIVSSLSRSGIAAMLGATVLTIIWLRSMIGLKIRWWALAGVAVCAVVLIAWVGLSQSVSSRLGTLFDVSKLFRDPRFYNWFDSLQAWTDFWLLGSGLGTYPYTYGPYQHIYFPDRFMHAENDYVEALVVGGLIGLILLLSTLAAVTVALARSVRLSRDRTDVALALAGVFALLSQVFQATLDFGLYLSANLMLFSLICGASAGRAIFLAGKNGKTSTASWNRLSMPRSSTPMLLGLVAFLMFGSVFGWYETRRLSPVQEVRRAIEGEKMLDDSSTKLEAAIERLGSALQRRWDDADGHLTMAKLLMRRYRIQIYRQVKDQLPEEQRNKALYFDFVSELHTQATRFAYANNQLAIEQLRNDPLVMEYLRPAWIHLVAARDACAYLPDVHRWLGTLCFLNEAPLEDQKHFQQALYVAPADAYILNNIGLLYLYGGREAEALQCLKTAWKLEPILGQAIMRVLEPRLTVAEILDQVAPASPMVLVEIARNYYGAPHQAADQQQILQRAEKLLSASQPSEVTREYLAGAIDRLRGQRASAIRHLSRAVQLAPQQAAWRFDLAVLLKQEGRINEARQQAEWCVLHDPYTYTYREFLKELPSPTSTAPKMTP